jgi:hypothetical protein
MDGFYFHERRTDGEDPAGLTVSKRATLPEGDFMITEYCWGAMALWFVDSDNFTADERQSAYEAFMLNAVLGTN